MAEGGWLFISSYGSSQAEAHMVGSMVPFEVVPEVISTDETGLWHHSWLLPQCPEPLATPCQANWCIYHTSA